MDEMIQFLFDYKELLEKYHFSKERIHEYLKQQIHYIFHPVKSIRINYSIREVING